MVDAQTISIIFAGVSIGVAAIYYMLTLRYTRRNQELTLKAQEQALETRQAQLFMQLFDRWLASGYAEKLVELLFHQEWKDYEDWLEKYGPERNPEAANVYFTLDTYFEGIGTLIKRKLVDPSLVDDLMGSDIVTYWDKIRPIAEGIRKNRNIPSWAEHSEYLYNVVSEIFYKQHPELKT
ncbi:MAG: DUF4760 domain-containing protein [Candidatus Thorarchaeota archaeon]|jgi:hypothetical protein